MKKEIPKAPGVAKLTRSLSNIEIVTLSVYLLNGDSHYVQTEDVAIKANELAPGRFTWRRYPAQINLEIVRVYLSDGKKPDKGGYLLGSGTRGWLLTEKGLGFAKREAEALPKSQLWRSPLSPRDQQLRRHEHARLLASDAYAKYCRDRLMMPTVHDAEELFKVDDYVVGKARERKIVRLVNMFAEDPELDRLLKAAAGVLREEK